MSPFEAIFEKLMPKQVKKEVADEKPASSEDQNKTPYIVEEPNSAKQTIEGTTNELSGMIVQSFEQLKINVDHVNSNPVRHDYGNHSFPSTRQAQAWYQHYQTGWQTGQEMSRM